MLIQIIGTIGSGKTYICDKLKKHTSRKIFCYDYDELYIDSWDDIRKNTSNIPKINNSISKRVNNKLSDLKHNLSKNDILVLTGNGPIFNKADKTYFIKIEDMDKTYRRFLQREFNKIVDNKSYIMNTINKEKTNLILENITNHFMLQDCFITFDKYKHYYNELLKDAKKNKYNIMLQDQIYKDIIKSLK